MSYADHINDSNSVALIEEIDDLCEVVRNIHDIIKRSVSWENRRRKNPTEKKMERANAGFCEVN